MSLYERLSKARGTEEAESTAGDGLVTADSPAPRQADPLDALKKKIHQSLVQALGPKLYDMNMTAEQLAQLLPGIDRGVRHVAPSLLIIGSIRCDPTSGW